MPPTHRRSEMRSMTPTEAREWLKSPARKGNMEKFLQRIVGTMSEEEVNELEKNINAMNERVEGDDPSR